MPTRWSYEALVYAQAKLNPLTIRQEKIQSLINEIIRAKKLTPDQADRLDDLKEALAVLSGLEASRPDVINKAFRRIDDVIAGARFEPSKFDNFGSGVSAEQLYVNQKVTDLVSKAEMEQSDYREDRHLNVFFGPMKEYLGLRAGILWFNTLVLIASTLFLFFVLYLILRSQIRVRNS
jgi:polyhydroxyalkanoate synthesis regulator phasin